MTQVILPGDTLTIEAVDQRENKHPSKETLAALAEAPQAAQPVTETCNRRYTARRTSGARPLAQIKWIVMHSTEGPSAQSAAAWFANNASQGSAHLCLDDRECYRTLDDAEIPWGAPGANYHGFHIEQAGHANWPSLIWSKTHRAELERSAYKTALHCRKFGIRPYFVTSAGLKKGQPGVTTHKQCSDAFGGTHWDPGTGWPRYPFMLRVRYHWKRLSHVPRVA